MRKLIITMVALTISVNAWMQTPNPVERKINKLNISIDPRMELLSTVQILSGYKVIDRNSPYSNDIKMRFKAFSDQKAILMTDDLFNQYGFSYDAPVAFMLYLSQVPKLRQQVQLTDYLIKRAGNEGNLNDYRTSLEQFAQDTEFGKFWDSKLEFYNKIVDLTVADLAGKDLVMVLEHYFNEYQNSYNIIISPSFKGGYGPKLKASNDKYDVYSCSSTTNFKDNVPYLNQKSLIYYVWHEFGHSFVNPQTDKYLEKVESFNELFEPIKNEMRNMAYSEWTTCVNEHIIRAINVRLQELYVSSSESRNLLNREKANRFIYIEPLIEKLKEYEKQRDLRKITFSEFYPQLLNVFDSLKKTDYIKLAERKFLGPINAATAKQKVAWIYPSHDTDTVSLRKVNDYVTMIFNMFKSENSILISDSTALTKDLADYGLMVYGTIESNLFLAHYKSSFPFKIENNSINADTVYKDENIKFISCLPNPLNHQKGMVIYTAFSNKNIEGINDVFHGSEDFVVFTDRYKVIKRGYYDKIGNWRYLK